MIDETSAVGFAHRHGRYQPHGRAPRPSRCAADGAGRVGVRGQPALLRHGRGPAAAPAPSAGAAGRWSVRDGRPELGGQHRVSPRPRGPRQVPGRRFVAACIWSARPRPPPAAGGIPALDPTMARRLGLDFVGVAVFVVVATILFRKRDIAPWAVAAAAAVAKWAIGGNWYIVIGNWPRLFGALRDLRNGHVQS